MTLFASIFTHANDLGSQIYLEYGGVHSTSLYFIDHIRCQAEPLSTVFATVAGGQVRLVNALGNHVVNMSAGGNNLASQVRSQSVGGTAPNMGPCFYCTGPHAQWECGYLRRMFEAGNVNAVGHPTRQF